MSASPVISQTVRLPTGFDIPVPGLGVYQNEECAPACVTALKYGYRHIDSARRYKNEDQVGFAVRESGVPREEIFITSKVFDNEHGYEATLKAVDDSLVQFGTDYLDLYLIHTALAGTKRRLETWRALIDCKKQGKLRTIGVSNYSIKHLEEIRELGLELPSINQVELHPFCQQKDVVEYCQQHGIMVQAYSPLVRGKLNHPSIQEVSANTGKNAAQVLIRWSLQRGFIPLPKSVTPERIASNLDVFDFEITPEDMAKLDALDRGRDGAVLPLRIECD